MRRGVVILGALSIVMIVAGFSALWHGSQFVFDDQPGALLDQDWEAYLRNRLWLQMLADAGAPVIGGGLIAGIGAVALVVRSRSAIRG
jgi:hypothetical protein